MDGPRLEHRVPFLLAALLIAVVCNARAGIAQGTAAPGAWGEYHDKNLGLALEFPSDVFPLNSAEQRKDATVFLRPDGRARLRVFGAANQSHASPRTYLSRIADTEAARFTYVRTAPSFFVASGTREGMIFYRRCNFSAGADPRIACFQLDYPQNEKRAYDAMVTRISRSLRATSEL